MACALLVTVVFSDSDVCAQAIRTVNPYYMPNPPKQPLPPIGPLVENLDTAWPADQVSLVRIWLGHACPFKGYFHCNHRHLDMYSCWGCDHLHPDTCPCGSGESFSSGCVHLCLDTHTYSGKPVQGSFSFILAHILVDQVSQSVQVRPPPSWHAYLWIIKTVSSGYLHFHLWHKYLRIR